MQTAICYLIINRIPDMPFLAIESMLANTSSDVFIGYLHEGDLPEIPTSSRIHLLNLKISEEFQSLSLASDYLPFDSDQFFRLVALKWKLFKEIFELGYECVIYSDLDVMVFSPIDQELSNTFNKFPDFDVLIQDATSHADDPKLCMGLVALRKSPRVEDLLQDCFIQHIKATQDGARIGDDDIITRYYLQENNMQWIMRLPQVSFPVGRLLNLFSTRDIYPGLGPVKPKIFHSNYVIGRRNKVYLMQLSASLIDRNKYRFGIKSKIVIFLKRVRLFAGMKKKLYISNRKTNCREK